MKRLLTFGIGMTLYAIFNWFFNYPLYVWVVNQLGLVKGGGVMFLLSFAHCIILLCLYDRLKIDWVGVGYMDEVKAKENKTRFERILTWAINKEGKRWKTSFCVYSCLADPFVVTVHYRPTQFNGVTGRDLLILLSSTLIANFGWTLGVWAVTSIAKWAWGII